MTSPSSPAPAAPSHDWRLLVAIGTRVQAAMRDADTVARLGGDEFLVLASDVTGEVEVERIAERLLETIAEPQELGGRKVVARCSVGIALYPDNGDNVETLVANADNAMYQAKGAQQGTATFFTEEMNTRLRKRVQPSSLEDALLVRAAPNVIGARIH